MHPCQLLFLALGFDPTPLNLVSQVSAMLNSSTIPDKRYWPVSAAHIMEIYAK
jgi:hypothetical protein